MTTIHVWYNTDYTSYTLRPNINKHSLVSHIRSESLDKPYLTHIVNSVSRKSSSPALHVLILTNKDVQIRQPELLPHLVNILYQVSECQSNAKFVCIDLLSGKSSIIKQVKQFLIEAAFENRSAHHFHDLGRRLSPDDFLSRSKLSLPGSRRVESKLVRIIMETIEYQQ